MEAGKLEGWEARKAAPADDDAPSLMDRFESWLLGCRVAQAVAAGEVSADLLTELHAEIEATRGRPQEEGHVEAVQDITEKLDIPLERAEGTLATLEAQPTTTRELLLRETGETWLKG